MKTWGKRGAQMGSTNSATRRIFRASFDAMKGHEAPARAARLGVLHPRVLLLTEI